jgi:hypothetical protein
LGRHQEKLGISGACRCISGASGALFLARGPGTGPFGPAAPLSGKGRSEKSKKAGYFNNGRREKKRQPVSFFCKLTLVRILQYLLIKKRQNLASFVLSGPFAFFSGQIGQKARAASQ